MKLYLMINKCFEICLVVLVALQAILLMASVFFRYAFNSPIIWGDEIVRYSLVWMTFVGAALATKENQHISVDVIDLALPELGKKILNWFVDIVVVAFMVIIIYYGIKMTDFQRGTYGETLAWFSYAYVYVSIPVGGVFIIFYTITKYFIKKEDELDKSEVC
jgi:TRAP-type C4-dicarboxylate transport system permease small subunit